MEHGGTRQRLKPGGATMRSLENSDGMRSVSNSNLPLAYEGGRYRRRYAGRVQGAEFVVGPVCHAESHVGAASGRTSGWTY